MISKESSTRTQANNIQIDAFKGTLILLVVLGHNSYFSQYYPLLFSSLYNFHVACFLLLVFVYHAPDTGVVLVDRIVRYLVPHFVFFSLACGLYYIFYVFPGNINLFHWIKSVFVAVLLSSEETYNLATGFRLFWFLPSLVVLVSFRFFYKKANKTIRLLALCCLLFAHCIIGFIPRSFLPYFPWSTPLIFFLFPLGLLIAKLWSTYNERQLFYWICFIYFIAALYVSITFKSFAGLAGDPRVYSIADPIRLLFHDTLLISAFFPIMGSARIFPGTILSEIGKRSLFIFLSHPFIWQALVRSGLVEYVTVRIGSPLITVVFTFLLTMGIALSGSLFVEKNPMLYQFVFPRGRDDWPVAVK